MPLERPKIPSEILEPHLATFMEHMFELVSMGQVSEARTYIKGVNRFVGLAAGVHAVLAWTRIYHAFVDSSDDDLIAFVAACHTDKA